MALIVDVLVDPGAGDAPPAGTPVHVELRDTSMADAPATVLASADGVVAEQSGRVLATVQLPEAAAPAGRATLWAHADVDGDAQVSVGDFITMQSHVAPSPEQSPGRVTVTVRPVR